MRGMRCVTAAGLLSLLASACTAPPPLTAAMNNYPYAAKIPIDDIVQRVKCDLTAALYKKVFKSSERDRLTWMQNWTAKADLTLEANESGGITPNVAFIQPLHNAFFLGAGPTA
jgi:hypothetical protein